TKRRRGPRDSFRPGQGSARGYRSMSCWRKKFKNTRMMAMAHLAFLGYGTLETIRQPTTRGSRRIPGLDLDKPRCRALLQAATTLAPEAEGFTNAEFRGVWSVLRVPTVDEEDRRHLHRELWTVKKEYTRVTNRIQGLLAN